MPVVNLSSAELTNTDATPIVANDVRNIHGRVRIKSATIASAAGDSDLSSYRFFRVRSGDSLKSIQCYHDDIANGTDWDCGLYTINGGAVVDVDLYADGFTLATAQPAIPHALADAPYLELRFGDVTTSTVQDINNMIWEDLGLSTDPQLEYDLVLFGNTVGDGGDITLIVYYTAGD